jgi:hypothetical protein
MIKKHQTKARFGLIIGTILMLMIVSILFGLVWPPLLIKAGSTLPPRHSPAPSSPADDSDDGDDDDTPLGAHIELQVAPVQVGLWTVVQWQDSAGNWHDVDGWRGTLETGGYKRWWVALKDFGTGPFRWVATQGPGGPVLGMSEPFSLPAEANEVVPVTVSLE